MTGRDGSNLENHADDDHEVAEELEGEVGVREEVLHLSPVLRGAREPRHEL